jgi:small subunit ribosomal protein S7
MPRKKRDFTREILPDPKYKEVIVSKTVNTLTTRGKRSIAEKALYTALDQVEKKMTGNPMETFKKAISNVRPLVEVRSRRVGGATYQVPTEVRATRSESLAIRWIVQAANERGEREISERLANEILEAAQNRGGAVKKREDTHRMAEANKAFAHFKW